MTTKLHQTTGLFLGNGSHLPMLGEMTGLILEASRNLVEMMRNPDPDDSAPAARIKKLEHCGDRLTHGILYQRRRSSPISPAEEEFHELLLSLEELLNLIDNISMRLILFQIKRPIPLTSELALALLKLVEKIDATASHPWDERAVSAHCREIKRLGSKTDQVFQTSLARLSDEVIDPSEAMKCRDVIHNLGAAILRARVFGSILNRPLSYRLQENSASGA